MFTVYVIENPKKNWYIGKTSDLERRLNEHNKNTTYTTKRLCGPWKIVHCEQCLNEWDAKKRERSLKTSHGREYLAKRLHHYIYNS